MIRFKYIVATLTVASSSFCFAQSDVAELAEPELTAQWWQWAMSVPKAEGPVADLVGTNCAVGQAGPVWFLAGGFGSSKIRRTCNVPSGKKLFFPLVNMAYWPQHGVRSITCADTKAAAALNNDTALDLFAELDGTTLTNLARFRISSDACFDIYARRAAEVKPYNAFPSATDGFWLLLRPLDPGRHVLKFGGRYNRKSVDYGRMVQDIEYVLHVQ